MSATQFSPPTDPEGFEESEDSKDVLAYREQRAAKRRAFLDDLTRETMADGSFFTTAAEADAVWEAIKDQ